MFPALAANDFVYLNTGSSGPPPYHVIDAMRRADDLCSGPAYLEGVGLFYKQAEYASRARQAAARYARENRGLADAEDAPRRPLPRRLDDRGGAATTTDL